MHLPLQKRRRGLRDALHLAHETYRAYSGTIVPAPPTAQKSRRRHSTVAVAPPVRAAQARPVQRPRDAPARRADPDVLLDVPSLKVDEIRVEVEDLQARVALEAHVMDLLRVDVGADVSLARVSLDIKGVEARARLRVQLDRVAAIVDRVMDTVDTNPQIVEGLTSRLGGTLEQLGSGAGHAVGQIGDGAGSAVAGLGESVRGREQRSSKPRSERVNGS